MTAIARVVVVLFLASLAGGCSASTRSHAAASYACSDYACTDPRECPVGCGSCVFGRCQ